MATNNAIGGEFDCYPMGMSSSQLTTASTIQNATNTNSYAISAAGISTTTNTSNISTYQYNHTSYPYMIGQTTTTDTISYDYYDVSGTYSYVNQRRQWEDLKAGIRPGQLWFSEGAVLKSNRHLICSVGKSHLAALSPARAIKEISIGDTVVYLGVAEDLRDGYECHQFLCSDGSIACMSGWLYDLNWRVYNRDGFEVIGD